MICFLWFDVLLCVFLMFRKRGESVQKPVIDLFRRHKCYKRSPFHHCEVSLGLRTIISNGGTFGPRCFLKWLVKTENQFEKWANNLARVKDAGQVFHWMSWPALYNELWLIYAQLQKLSGAGEEACYSITNNHLHKLFSVDGTGKKDLE